MSTPKPKSRGGARPGAGRKPGSGPHGEPTQPIRLPVSAVPALAEDVHDLDGLRTIGGLLADSL